MDTFRVREKRGEPALQVVFGPFHRRRCRAVLKAEPSRADKYRSNPLYAITQEVTDRIRVPNRKRPLPIEERLVLTSFW